MSNIYQADITLRGTIYVRAESLEEAKQKIAARDLDEVYLQSVVAPSGELPISGKRFDDPDLPEISLSPVATVCTYAEDELEPFMEKELY